VAAVLTLIGKECYEILRTLTAPEKPAAKSYVEITELLRNYFKPKALVIAERFKFWKRSQRIDESITEYSAALRKLATTCKFGDHLEEMLRDKLVLGIRQENIQRRLLAIDDLSFKKAIESA